MDFSDNIFESLAVAQKCKEWKVPHRSYGLLLDISHLSFDDGEKSLRVG